MKAVKDNKVYTVDEISKKDYLAMGYDIYGDDGTLKERSPSSTVSRREYDELLAKYEKLKTSVGVDAHIDPSNTDEALKNVGGAALGVPKKDKKDVSGTK